MKNWVKILIFLTSFFILITHILFKLNETKIYAQLGTINAKKGNYQQAQTYYQKSYEHGNQDTDFRIMYVNSLINSPLTIEAQEKLVQIAEDNIQDSASESAKYFLHNLKKEINNKYPDNYVKQAPYNQQIIHWGKMPITYSLKKRKGISPELISAVNDAFDTIERASSVRIRFEKVPTDNADIVVDFNQKQITKTEFGEKYIIAYTIPSITQNKLYKMDMQLNTFNIDGNLFSPNQMYNIALHEIFHALGFLGHSFDKENIMYISQTNEPKENEQKRELSDADKKTLELFYKIKPDITNANELKYEYIPYLILGDTLEINEAKAEEAKKYIQKAPTIPAGYIDLAQTLLNKKKYTSAISYLEKALRLATDKETKYLVFYNLAVTNFYDGNYELANIYIDKAKEYKDENDLHILSAEIFIKQNKLEDAIKEYSNLLNNNPDNINYATSIANIYIKKKDYIKARKVIKTFIKQNPESKNSFKQYGILLIF